MKFVLNENLFRVGEFYVGVIKQPVERFKLGDVFGQIVQYPTYVNAGKQETVIFNNFREGHTEYFNTHSEIKYLFKPIFCSINLNWGLPKVSLPDTEIEHLLNAYYDKLSREDIRGGRNLDERNYQVQGFEDGYNKAKEHFRIIDRRGIKEIELEDDVEDCFGDCEQPDIWNSCNDGCINSRIVPRVVDGKVIVKNIVYDDTL